MSPRKVELMISGVVQGVGFRYFAFRAAQQAGVVGWARNLPDGRVQVVAEGERGPLEILINELKVGPSYATVSDIKIDWSNPTDEFTSFEIR